MDSSIKTMASSLLVAPALLNEAAPFERASGIPVGRALAAIAEPDSIAELGQRLGTTLAMLWSDIADADLFLPQGESGELRGVRDATAGQSLLGAVGAPYGDVASVRVVPVSPRLVDPDPALARGATMSVPVLCAGVTEGFIIVQRRPAARAFSSVDLEALTRLAGGVGELLPRVRARGGRSASTWIQRDMAAAREMQRMFLPRPSNSNSAGVRVLSEYMPAFDVGGDFYDFVDLGQGRLLAAIGDVSGKGVAAALIMSRLSSELHRLAGQTTGPAEMLTRLNQSFPGGFHDDRFATVVCVLLDVPKRRWVVANAGHVVPILRRRAGAVSGLAYSSGPPIGMMPDAAYEDEVFPLESKDILVLATDGVFESVDGPRLPCSTMGQCKLTDIVRKAPHDLAEIHRRILHALEHATGGRDDVALLGLELTE